MKPDGQALRPARTWAYNPAMLANTNHAGALRPPRPIAWLCFLGLALILAGCVGLPLGDGEPSLASDCVWTLVIKEPGLADSVGPLLKDGRAFVIEGRRLAREHPASVRQDLGCPRLAELPHGLVEAAEHLALGQVAGPLALREGVTWVMRGSDRHRLLGQALLERKRYPDAIAEAQEDLMINPASVGSWLVLGQSRLALDDPAGALQAFEQGLLVDPLDPPLRASRDQARQAAAQAAAKPATAPPGPPLTATQAPTAPSLPPAKAPAPAAPASASSDRAEAAPPAQAIAPAGPSAPEPVRPATPPVARPEPPAEAQAFLDQARQAEARGDRRAATLAYHRAARLDPNNDTAKEGLRRNFLALNLGAGSATQAPPLAPVLAQAPKPAPLAPVPTGSKANPSTPPAPPPPPAAKAPPPAPPVKTAARELNRPRLAKGVYVQVASNRDQAKAEQEAGAWKRRKLPTQVASWQARDGVVWWRVLLGPYPDRKRAQAAAQGLQRQGILDFYLLLEPPRP